MEKLVYVKSNGTKETSYKEVKGTEYTVTLEPVRENETEEMRNKRLERIAKAQAGITKAYDEYKALMAQEDVKGVLYGIVVRKPKKPTEEVAQA